jgi:hypothetical protein
MSNQSTVSEKRRRRHPLFGFMKGTVSVAPGVNLIEPACPEWAEIAEEKCARLEMVLKAARTGEKT